MFTVINLMFSVFKMSTPLSMEPAKSANSKEKNSNKKLKEIDRTSVSASSGNSKRTMSTGMA